MRGATRIEETEAKLAALIRGLKARRDQDRIIYVDGEAITIRELRTRAEARHDRYTAVKRARRLVTMCIGARDRGHPSDLHFLLHARTSIKSTIGSKNTELPNFGIPMKTEPRKLTAEEKLMKAKRARETRARNKKGKKKD
jgi:hypothetical protein